MLDLEAAQKIEILDAISLGLDQARRGEVKPMRAFLEDFAKKKGFSLK